MTVLLFILRQKRLAGSRLCRWRIDGGFGRGRERVQIHKYTNTNHKHTNTNHKYTNMRISWWLMRNLEEAEKECRYTNTQIQITNTQIQITNTQIWGSVDDWWGIWKRQRKSADTQIQKYKSQIHKYEDQGCISWWLVRNLEDAEEVKEMHFLPKRHFTYIWITPIV